MGLQEQQGCSPWQRGASLSLGGQSVVRKLPLLAIVLQMCHLGRWMPALV